MIGKMFLWFQQNLKRWIKPARPGLISGLLSDFTHSRADLIAENALLRQQIIVLDRQIQYPQLTNQDRLIFVLLARFTKFWRQSIHIVQPDTLLRWHRDLFRWHWRRKSQGQSKISPETIVLIRTMAKENPMWGAERIRGELLKLGIEPVSVPFRNICRKSGSCLLRARLGRPSLRIKRMGSGLVTLRLFMTGYSVRGMYLS